jgi:uncharacterized protein YjbI with pentapeptide repeats
LPLFGLFNRELQINFNRTTTARSYSFTLTRKHGTVISEAALRGTGFSEAALRGTGFSEAALRGTGFSEAELS